ncbi:MAG: SRPBCC domain-containing protein [Hyphomicrobiaceae bacterium]|nr:SRPBCC domain-containing protein [Hyphomicrobiaceae bacterium]
MSDRPELSIERLFNAPKDLVFSAWTKAEHFQHWFLPPGFKTVFCEVDPRVGGLFRIHWEDADGNRYPNKGLFTAVEPTDMLAYEDSFDDDRENNTPTKVTVTFEDMGGKTRVVTHSLFASHEILEEIKAMGAVEIWNLTLDQAVAYVEGLAAA